jgi:glycolate oxidase FAD binding subunit
MITDASAAIVPRLQMLLGGEFVSTAEAVRYPVDGIVPRVVVRPGDAAQVAAVLRLCAEAGAAVTPWGGGTAIEVGNPPRALDVVLMTDRLSAVVDHDHSNLTVTVQAGITLGALGGVLAAHGQFLPVEPPRAEAATAGGTVAVNLNGPRRMRYGSARDVIVGMRTAQTDGVVVKTGGKTVKNVAGYDMGRLHVGALGTLAVITEITFKVSPVPETSATVVAWAGDASRLLHLARRVFESVLTPSAVVLVSRAAAGRIGGAAPGLLVRVEGVEPGVARHTRDITGWASRDGIDADVVVADRETALWHAIRDFGWRDTEVAIRASVPPGRTAALIDGLGTGLPAASAAVTDLGTGTFWAVFDSRDATAWALPAIEGVITRLGGNLLLARAPRSLKAGRDVWTPLPDQRALDVMRALKQSFDPRSILNPGRYVAGL